MTPTAVGYHFAGFPRSNVSPISCADNAAFDHNGRLWIATDGNQLRSNDGMFAVTVHGQQRGHLKQVLPVPIGVGAYGPRITDDGKSVMVAVQHPGETDDARFDYPASIWPRGDGSLFPGRRLQVAPGRSTGWCLSLAHHVVGRGVGRCCRAVAASPRGNVPEGHQGWR